MCNLEHTNFYKAIEHGPYTELQQNYYAFFYIKKLGLFLCNKIISDVVKLGRVILCLLVLH